MGFRRMFEVRHLSFILLCLETYAQRIIFRCRFATEFSGRRRCASGSGSGGRSKDKKKDRNGDVMKDMGEAGWF